MRSERFGDHLEIVLDHQDGAIGRDAPDQRGDALDVLEAQARHRFVEQQHLRDRAPASWRSPARACGHRRSRPRPNGPSRPGRPRSSSSIARALSGVSAFFERQKSKLSPRLRCNATRTFSSAVRWGKIAEIWNERARPRRATSAGRVRGDVAAVEQDAAEARRDELGQHVEAGRLAGPVGADQRVNRAAPDLEIDVADRREAAKGLAEALGDKDVVLAHRRRPLRPHAFRPDFWFA